MTIAGLNWPREHYTTEYQPQNSNLCLNFNYDNPEHGYDLWKRCCSTTNFGDVNHHRYLNAGNCFHHMLRSSFLENIKKTICTKNQWKLGWRHNRTKLTEVPNSRIKCKLATPQIKQNLGYVTTDKTWPKMKFLKIN